MGDSLNAVSFKSPDPVLILTRIFNLILVLVTHQRLDLVKVTF